MNKQSLFGILSRSPWWLSLVIAVALFAGLASFLPPLVAASAALPFVAIAIYAGWKQSSVPSDKATEKLLQDVRDSSWEQFSERLSEAFRREGYEVSRTEGADWLLKKGGRRTLATCRRWKVGQTGVGPLKDLVQAREKLEADECLYVSAGVFTPQAETFAAEHRVRLLSGRELARMVKRVPVKRAA